MWLWVVYHNVAVFFLLSTSGPLPAKQLRALVRGRRCQIAAVQPVRINAERLRASLKAGLEGEGVRRQLSALGGAGTLNSSCRRARSSACIS